MTRARYAISDEPHPGNLSRLLVSPFWPVLACMMVGGLPGMAWLAFNGFALGSPTRKRELLLCVAGIVLSITVFVLIQNARQSEMLTTQTARYLFLLVLIVKLGFAYMACFLQQRSLELYEYFGGKKANGLIPVVVAVLLAPSIFKVIFPQSVLPFLFL